MGIRNPKEKAARKRIVLAIIGAALSGSLFIALAQAPAPKATSSDHPLRAVHLMNIADGQEIVVLAKIRALNLAIAKAGCPSCQYRLWRIDGKQAGSFHYFRESTWPSRAVYDRIHKLPALKNIGNVDSSEEIYNRYVEVIGER